MSVSVSETIGKLLLEGYKMLADSCDVCCTVLMQDRRGRIICVQCESASMANAAAHESMNALSGPNVKIMNGGNATASHGHSHSNIPNQGQRAIVNGSASANASNNANNSQSDLRVSISTARKNSEEVIAQQIQYAASALKSLSQEQHALETKSVYLKYIRECAETLQVLRNLGKE